MEYILIFISLLSCVITSSIKFNNATSYGYILECIDESLFRSAIDYDSVQVIGNNTYLQFDRSKLEDNIVVTLSSNIGHFKGSIDLTFFYYNISEQKDCIANSLYCDGVELKLVLVDQTLFKERYYRYEIIQSV